MNLEKFIFNKPAGNHLKAIILLISTAILWSAGGLLIKLVSWNSIAIAGGRSLIAALLILAFMGKPRMKWSPTFIGAIIAYAGTVILFVISNKLTTAANAILLQYTAPIYIAVFGVWLLKERATFLDWSTIFVVLGGMVLFFKDDISGGNMLGNIMSILSGLCFAFLIMLMRKQKDGSPLESVFWGNVLTALIGIPFMFTGVPDSKSLLGLLLLGVFQLGMAYVLYSMAVKHVTALEAVLIPIIEPILNPIWVLLIIGEKPGLWSLIGGAVIIAAIAFRGVVDALKPKAEIKVEG